MVDVLTKKQRSYCMSRIKGSGTKPELFLRRLLCAEGFKGYRLEYKIFGKPDISFPKSKIAVFIDGCFWHKCPVCFIKPETNIKFWTDKINLNINRDRIVNDELKKTGWKVIRIWEHELKEQKIIKRKVIGKIERWLKK